MSDNLSPKQIDQIYRPITPHQNVKRKTITLSPNSIDQKREENKERCKRRRLEIIKNKKEQQANLGENNEETLQIFFEDQWCEKDTLSVIQLKVELKRHNIKTTGYLFFTLLNY